MSHSGCALVRHFQPRVHHICMSHSLPCMIGITVSFNIGQQSFRCEITISTTASIVTYLMLVFFVFLLAILLRNYLYVLMECCAGIVTRIGYTSVLTAVHIFEIKNIRFKCL